MASRRRLFILLAILALVVGIDTLERPLANPDEGRYSEISREMAASGDWITPRLNGLKYFEKPPLQYWATAVSFSLFGENEYTARFYTAFCGLLTLFATWFTMRRLTNNETALLATGVLLSSPYFMALGVIVTLDMGLTCWLTVALAGFLYAQSDGTSEPTRRRAMGVAWAGMALAVLSKGLIGIVFPAAAIFLHCLLHRDWTLLKRLAWGRGIAIFLAIAAPWFVMVSRANPEFAHFFFVHEHFERFLTTQHRRVEPAWYFVPILFFGVLPWMFTLPSVAAASWLAERERRSFPWRRFALLWAGFIFLFFSASGSKLPAYLLPVFPMLALVIGDWLARTEPRRIALYLLPVVVVIVIGLAIGWGAPERAKSAWTRDLYGTARPFIVAGGLVISLGIAGAAWLLRKGERVVPLAIVVLATLVFVDCVEDGYEMLSPRQSGRDAAAVTRQWVDPSTRIYSVNYYDQTFPFYLKREVTLVNYVDEFALGQASEPRRSLPTVAAFVEDWKRPGSAVAIMQPGLLEEVLKPAGLAMILIHADERRVVVRKP
ncbi:hypothetical protein BWI17_13805 [Betaproteobacteria bacterium GR16-43]|nr:hypothetical protein BWI17_13805 [Betaproteobacteria bacterium GR16-43]